MRHLRPTSATAATTAAAALLLAGATSAAADPPPGIPPAHAASSPQTVVDGLAGPLSFDVTPDGTVYVGQAFAGLVTRVSRTGERTDLVATEGAGVGAVSYSRGTLTWAERTDEDFVVTSAVLVRRAADGSEQTVDVLAYEAGANPDQGNTYGIQGLSEECAASLPPEVAPFLLPYTGQVDSNPYASVTVGGTTYVADAGANAVLAVSADGEVSTAAVLPPVPIEITAGFAESFGLDACVVGLEYWAEPVPTDVEVGRHGVLYVSSLPGGPEDGSLGANGGVFTVDPRTGDVDLVHRGFLGATDLAVAPDGTVYVTELFGGRLSAITRTGEVRTVAELTEPAAVEWQRGRLYVATGAFGDGSIVTMMPARPAS
ncbi:ScyD/ScyE family protein [Cellulomonas carbonis]|uniref:ScyD/ScyE family protein n=1 Tax=Cellulomonas carbonis T26 TaxID=947969 RepID=A0A0A0BS01_9CELL|nr:ScyD/ScyE family protein [Cellulomonas carbonis]KGM09924.1 hypothetical protein N868_17555 [Cellulomonas carbonis T26]GGC10389.1 hypothetical protein GCM10010972_24600 [Cellulomonas carbonis]